MDFLTYGQTTYDVLSETSYSTLYANPYRGSYEDVRHQYIYTAAELTAAGLTAGDEISALAFKVRNKYSSAPYMDFTISLGHTSASSLPSGYDSSPLTTCYIDNYTTVASSWNTHNFNFSNFTWNGSDNLLVQVCYNNAGWTSSDQFYYNSSSWAVYYDYDDGVIGCSMSGYNDDNYRPIIQLSTACPPFTTYYSKSSGDLDDLNTWGTEIDGTGCPPANFTTAGVTYYVHNNTAPTTSGTWTVSGAGSKVVVGDVDNTVVFTAGAALDFNCDLELAEDGTLNLNDNNMNLEGDLIRSNASAVFNPGPNGTNTVTFDGGTDQYINVTAAGGSTPSNADLTFYDVVVTNGSTVKMYYKFTNSKKLNINDLTVDSGNTLHFISD
jgi:hypothetical protein